MWVVLLIRVLFRALFYKGDVLYWGPKEGPQFRELYTHVKSVVSSSIACLIAW